MLKYLAPYCLLAATLILSACATTSSPTYSGDVRAALDEGVGHVKDAGRSMGDFFRNSFGTHIELGPIPAPPAVQPVATPVARPLPTPTKAKHQAAPSSDVQLYSVSPAGGTGTARLNLDSPK